MRVPNPEHVVLIGSMGSGKTTVGVALAGALGRPFLDSDAELARRLGRPTTEVLAAEGRAALHRAEAEFALSALGDRPPAVLALAASVVDDPDCAAAIAARGLPVYLRTRPDSLERRLAASGPKPLGADPATVVATLDAPRRAAYEALAALTFDTDEVAPAALAETIAAALRRRIEVPLGARTYPVLIGPGVRRSLAEVLPAGARRAAIVTQEGIGVEVDPGVPSATFFVGDGEAVKSLRTIEELGRQFARFGLTRADVIVAVGGGVVTDTAGFAASCYHRGTAYVNVATTLLGQIDAAVGGKTGVNLPEGKNLLGAFWQPSAVLCDTDTLDTLPEREWRSGLGEMVKYAFLGVDDLDRIRLVDQVAACTALKAEVVAEDEREGDRRMLLNYGHTLAHALEAAGFADGPGRDGVDLRHGEAVAIGIAFAARLACVLGRIDEARVERHREVLDAYGLPRRIPRAVELDELLVLMGRDKKATSGLTFILDGEKGAAVVRDVPESAVREAFAAASAEAD